MNTTATCRQAIHRYSLSRPTRRMASSMHVCSSWSSQPISATHEDVISPSSTVTVLPWIPAVRYRHRSGGSSGQQRSE